MNMFLMDVLQLTGTSRNSIKNGSANMLNGFPTETQKTLFKYPEFIKVV